MDDYRGPESTGYTADITECETRDKSKRRLNKIAVKHCEKHGARDNGKQIAVSAKRLHYTASDGKLFNKGGNNRYRDYIKHYSRGCVGSFEIGRSQVHAVRAHPGNKQICQYVADNADEKAGGDCGAGDNEEET